MATAEQAKTIINAQAAAEHPGHPCTCVNPLCTNGQRCGDWRITTVARSYANGGVFVAEIYAGSSWVARVKPPNDSATHDETRAFAERVCAVMNGDAS